MLYSANSCQCYVKFQFGRTCPPACDFQRTSAQPWFKPANRMVKRVMQKLAVGSSVWHVQDSALTQRRILHTTRCFVGLVAKITEMTTWHWHGSYHFKFDLSMCTHVYFSLLSTSEIWVLTPFEDATTNISNIVLVGLDSCQPRNVLKSDSAIRMHTQVCALPLSIPTGFLKDKGSAKPSALSSFLIC
jgi:hypothetical protein